MVDWGSSGLGVAFGARTGAGRRRAADESRSRGAGAGL
jgi:hypothetical protein